MSEESEESDNIGYLAQDLSGSEDEESISESELDQETEEESSSSDAQQLLDLEAFESGDSDLNESHSDYHGSSGISSAKTTSSFPQFIRLPLELRYRVWELFCPDLTAKARVYWLQYSTPSPYQPPIRPPKSHPVYDGPLLDAQTRPARTMMAVHRESRQLALKALPDVLRFQPKGKAWLRFNARRDIIYLSNAEDFFAYEEIPRIPGFTDQIRHLAVEVRVLAELGNLHTILLWATFPNLEAIYFATEPVNHSPEYLRWCTFKSSNQYLVEINADQDPWLEEPDMLYCWPDIKNHRDFAKKEINKKKLMEDMVQKADIDITWASSRTLNLWPLVQFQRDSNLDWFDQLATWDGKGKIEWPSDSDAFLYDSVLDEYESSGIDDSELSDRLDGLSSSEELDDFDEENSRISTSTDDETSEDGVTFATDLPSDDGANFAEFSNTESSSATKRGSPSEAESDHPVPQQYRSRLKRPRSRVVDSESEESESDGPRKCARFSGRNRRVILDSDDGEAESSHDTLTRARRKRTVMSEDEGEEDDEQRDEDHDDNISQSSAASDRPDASLDGDDSDQDWGAAVEKPLSFAEKLQLHCEKVPIPPDDDDGDSGDNDSSDKEGVSGDDYDAYTYADFQDDEDGNETLDHDSHGQDGYFDNEDEEGYGYED